MIFACPLGIEAQIKLIVPTKFEARLRERVVPKLRPRPTLCQIGRMRGNFVTDDARTNILFIRKTKVFFGSDIAEHGCPVPSNLSSTDRARDVIVAGGDIGDERPQGVEGSLETVPKLFVHIFLDALHRYVTGTFDHHLYVMVPSAFCQLAECAQFGELGFIVGVINRAGAKTIAQTERNVISLHDFADFIELRVQEILLMVSKTPLGHDRTASSDDSR